MSQLGALAPDRSRAILVIAPRGELAVALRERVNRELAVVRDVRPDEMAAGMRACVPWPWMVVGEVGQLDPSVLRTLSAEPVLIFWRGVAPGGLPPQVRHFSSFSALAEAVGQALGQRVAGLGLAPGLGVELPGGRLSGSLPLQALVSAHPHSFHLPARRFSSSIRTLAASGSGLRLERRQGGGIGLAGVAGGDAVVR